jgi:hypothetical protein
MVGQLLLPKGVGLGRPPVRQAGSVRDRVFVRLAW